MMSRELADSSIENENEAPLFDSINGIFESDQDSSKKRKRQDPHAPELEIDVSLPEPPSKKALRKAKKDKPSSSLPTSAVNDLDSTQEARGSSQLTISAASKENTKRTEHSIWIGNLPWAVTKSTLRSFITDNSDIVDDMITRVHMPAPQDAKTSKHALKPQNKGFAYVDFATAEAFTAALALSETLFGGRRVLIKDAKSFAGRPATETTLNNKDKTERKSGKGPSRRVFVGNLGFDVTQEVLTEHYQKCGEIENVHIATFEDTGKCKGFGWVTFSDVHAGEAAVRGWTLLPVEEELSEDDAGVSRPPETMDDAKAPAKKKKLPKPRKWFVNQLYGRPLRCEFAEDSTIRYKKRFGKDTPVNSLSTVTGRRGLGSTSNTAQLKHPKQLNRPRQKPELDITPGEPSNDAKRRGRNTTNYGDTETMYRTGAIAEAQGNKVVFN